jgi:hypothetical protein
MSRTARWVLLILGLAVGSEGCKHPSVTAVSLNPHTCGHKFAFLYDPCKEPEGIPFYLPKPLLIISKNFRNIEETKVGLTDGAPIPNFFDDQAKYADLNARTNFSGLDGSAATGTAIAAPAQTFPTAPATNLASAASAHVYSGTGAPVSPGVAPSDGLKPETFYTYHIIFVPDLTQKYGLRIKGGAGEIRAAMNLVNGWQFTGLGPYYMKDSSTAQNTLAGGITANLAASGVANVVKAAASLRGTPGMGKTQSDVAPDKGQEQKDISIEKAQALVDMIQKLRPSFVPIPGFAEISIYEPYISPEGTMEWKLLAEKQFTREVMGTSLTDAQLSNVLRAVPGLNFLDNGGSVQSGEAPPPPTGISPFDPGAPIVPAPAPDSPPPPRDPMAPPTAALSRPTPNLFPMLSTTGATRSPALQRSRLSLLPAATLRRSSIRTLAADAPKTDDALVQTQGPAPAAPAAPTMQLSPGTDTGTRGDKSTTNTNPVFEVTGAPPNAVLQLHRDGVLVNQIQTGPAASGTIAVPDNRNGRVNPGIYLYRIDAVAAGNRVPLGMLPLQIVAAEAEPTAAATQTAVAPAAAAFDRQLLQQVLARGGLFDGATPAAATIVPTPTAANQVNLHQYFGKTHVAGPASAAPARRFSLFHHKEKSRPVVRTIDVGGLSEEALSAAPTGTTALAVNTPPSTSSTITSAGTGVVPTAPTDLTSPPPSDATAPVIGR